jgi:hypothetical protein
MEMDPHSISCAVQLDSLKNGLPSRKKRATTLSFVRMRYRSTLYEINCSIYLVVLKQH